MLKIPTGIDDIKELLEGGYTYVDKSMFLCM